MNEELPTGFFTETAEFFRRYAESAAHRERQERFLEVARQALAKAPTNRPLCLDLGCGPGAITLGIAGAGFQTIGVDSTPSMIQIATEAAAAASSDVQRRCAFTCSDLVAFLESFTGRADLVISSSVFEYLNDPRIALELVSARLRSGGTFAVSLPNWRSCYRRLEPALALVKPDYFQYARQWPERLDINEMIRLAHRHGLDVERTSYFGQVAVKGHTILSRFSRSSLWGTLTLIVFLKQ